jgi:iron complex transport system substrate-binding protein
MARQTAPRSLGSVRLSKAIPALALAIVGAGAIAQTPERVVSINMCTDQLALDLAAPGQLVSVTHMVQRDAAPDIAAKARELPGNSAQAEDVYLMRPDLVLAGTFTAPATIRMLESLGIRVEQFAPATSLDDIPVLMERMGAVLNQPERAKSAIEAFDSERAQLSAPPARRPRVALVYVNSYAPGTDTLAHDILTSAGFDNVAAAAGVQSVRRLPLEQLIMLAPEVIIAGHNFPGSARAEDALDHPALLALSGSYYAGELTSPDWTCGTPRVLGALRDMVKLRDAVLAQ